jgi:hypothetical protein
MNKKLCRAAWLCLVLLPVTRVNAQSISQPHFGDQVTLLKLDNQVIRQPVLSDNGNNVYAVAETYEFGEDGKSILSTSVLQTDIVHWNLGEDLTFDNKIFSPEIVIPLPKDLQIVDGFSPDRQFLALRTNNSLQIVQLAALSFHASTALHSELTSNYGYSQWSGDSRAIAFIDDQQIKVWNFDEEIIKTSNLDYSAASLTNFADGWLIRSLDRATFMNRESREAFTVCDLYLDQCAAYQYPDHEDVIVSPDGETILVLSASVQNMQLSEANLGIWRRTGGVEYHLTDEVILDAEPFNFPEIFCPKRFSPDSRYIVSICVDAMTIWNVSNLELVQSLSGSPIAWLSNDDYVITLQANPSIILNIYQVGIEKPIETWTVETSPGLENLQEWINGFPGENERATIAKYGDRLLINLGLAALIIPIEYE